jgi:hypothetical protein
MSHFVRHDNKWRREKSPPPTPPKNGGDSSSQKSLVRMTIWKSPPQDSPEKLFFLCHPEMPF